MYPLSYYYCSIYITYQHLMRWMACGFMSENSTKVYSRGINVTWEELKVKYSSITMAHHT